VTQAVLTKPGTVLGTPACMAPESWAGVPADARSDVWALGVVLHEMATGERPFKAQSVHELAAAIIRDVPAPLPANRSPALQAIRAALPGEGARAAVPVGRRSARRARCGIVFGDSLSAGDLASPFEAGRGGVRGGVDGWLRGGSRARSSRLAWPYDGWSHPIDRGASAREPFGQPGRGVLRRRDERAAHGRPVEDQQLARHLADFRDAVPEGTAPVVADRTRAERRRDR
jgi:serine/threonine protein kinase